MLTRLVNGKRIEITPEEEAKIRAEWKYNLDNPSLKPVNEMAILKERLDALESEIESIKTKR